MHEPIFTNNYDGTYRVESDCFECGGTTVAQIDGTDLFRYRQGDYVQDAFPTLTPEQREALFISGICSVCWDKMFGDDDDF